LMSFSPILAFVALEWSLSMSSPLSDM
jgi:hypothetical protein